MSLPPLITSGYISCIKIFGQPILPPLMTEERRKEVSEDKARAIHIEQRINKKRNSVDSGVMTSSYIDNVKSQNNESVNVYSKCGIKCHDYKDSPVIKDFLNNNYPHLENDNCSGNLHNNTPENYKFKPFLSINSSLDTESKTSSHNTVCKQKNKILDSYNSCEQLSNGKPTIDATASFNKYIQDCRSVTSGNVKNSETYQVQQAEYCGKENRDIIGTSIGQDPRLTSPEFNSSSGNDIHQLNEDDKNVEPRQISDQDNMERGSQTPRNMIRRNSYTLESPSPVLLEHLLLQEKQKTFIVNNNNNNSNENTNNDKVEKLNSNSSPGKGNLYPTFKSSSVKRRRVWNKAEAKAYWTNHLSSQDMRLTRSFTSIPASICTNSLNVKFHSLSLESLIITSNINEYIQDCNRRYSSVSNESEPIPVSQFRSLSAESFNKINNRDSTIHTNSGLEYDHKKLANKLCQFENTGNKIKLDNVTLPKTEEAHISDLIVFENSNESNTHFIRHSTRDKQHSVSVTHQGSVYSHKCNNEHSEDSFSFCSTSSLNHKDNVYQQQMIVSSEEQSCVIALKMRHEQQIKELLQRQQEELKQLSVKSNSLCLPPENSDSELESNMTRVSSSQSSHLCCTEMSVDMSTRSERKFCNRELFPKSSGYSKKEIRAATIINAYARGFLTRRLLRTKRVCQVIETIRESLVCALEMRNEQQLELKDLQLHDRLIQQLTHGCHELHNIFSLSAAERMAIIAADREKERCKLAYQFKTPGVSSATRRSMLRKQNKKLIQNMPFTPRAINKKVRSRTPSSGTSDSSQCSSRSRISAKSQQPPSPCLSRKPWR